TWVMTCCPARCRAWRCTPRASVRRFWTLAAMCGTRWSAISSPGAPSRARCGHNATTTPAQAARPRSARLGHSVAMLLKRYANCIDDQERAANERIAQALDDDRV